MKSFVRNLDRNSGSLREDRRFQALVKQQENEHAHLIANHHKEMQELRNSLSLAIDKCDSLSKNNETQLKDFKTWSVCQIGMLQAKVRDNQEIIDEQKKTIEALNKQLNEYSDIYSTKVEAEKDKKELHSRIHNSSVSNIFFSQELHKELNLVLNLLSDDFTKHKNDSEKKISDLISQIESNANITQINRKAFVDLIAKWEKTTFTIEKKIENIYTLIDRINKRGDTSCHKLA